MYKTVIFRLLCLIVTLETMYKTLIYRLWCCIDTLELKIRHHGERINAIRGPLNPKTELTHED